MADRPRPNWPPRALSEPDAAYYVSLSITSLRTEVEAGRAPKPFWLTAGRKAWLRDDLDAYLEHLAGRSAIKSGENDWQMLFEN
jgi:predicted DNA-binding transcriptional regulator AlpA